MGLDIYFKRVRGGQSANDALKEKRNKRNEEFKAFLATIEDKDLAEIRANVKALLAKVDNKYLATMKDKDLAEAKAELQEFLWTWEWAKANQASTLAEVMDVVREFYPQENEESWELLDYEGNRCRRERFYFRKVNCIYGYCANHNLIEDGEVAMLDHEQMVDILDKAKEILSQTTDEKKLAKGEELLPTQGGFFFGSTDYDNWYLNDIAEIVGKFRSMLDEWDDAYAVIFSW